MTVMDMVGGSRGWDPKHLSLDAVRKNTAGQLTEDGKNSVKADAKKRQPQETTSHQYHSS